MSGILIRLARLEDAIAIQNVESVAFVAWRGRLFPKVLTDPEGYVAFAVETYRKIIDDKHSDQTWIVAEDIATGDIAGAMRFRKVDDAGAQPYTPMLSIPFGGDNTIRYFNASTRMRCEVMGSRPHYLIQTVATRPNFQRCGVGSQLLSYLTNIADASNFALYLQSSPIALMLYQKHGFVEQGQTVLFPVAPGEEPDGEVVTVMVREPQYLDGVA
ncbi:acyl-CoA N-acyltransferase [Auriculariales sp. MPI-PUGE-AT-0066]|nr:acyl-CoA N-acyltransferase [Auriculariales sp. MPI-PUGE-AT-0066]